MGGVPVFLNTVDYSDLVGSNINLIQNNAKVTSNDDIKNQSPKTDFKISKGNQKKDIVGIQLSLKGKSSKSKISEEEKLQQLRQIIAKLQAIDQKVRAHEMAHMAAGGLYAGGASYSYVRGPDGRLYAVAGEVPIDISDASTPEETVVKMQTVIAAALAPADPSPQDLKVAAIASQKLMKALSELMKKQHEEVLGKHHTTKGSKNEKQKAMEGRNENKPAVGADNTANSQKVPASLPYHNSCSDCQNRVGKNSNPFESLRRVYQSAEGIEKIFNPFEVFRK